MQRIGACKISASLCTKDEFKAYYPLVKVVVGESKFPASNKFSTELRIDPAVRLAALTECAREVWRSLRLYGDSTDESKSVEFKSALLRNLEQFTVPSNQTLTRLENTQVLYEKLTGKKRQRVDRSQLDGLSDQMDLIMEDAAEPTELRMEIVDDDGNEDEDEDVLIDLEDPEYDCSTPLIYTGKKVYVREAKQDAAVEASTKKLVLIVEESLVSVDRACYQGAQSAVKMATKLKGPVYILSLGNKWKYAILHVRGTVRVNRRAIDPSSLPEFRKQEREMGFQEPIPDEELERMLSESVSGPGECPVGTLYVSNVWRTLPNDTTSECATADMHLFYEGLLRILVGDAVVNWHGEEMERVRKVQRFLSDESFELSGVSSRSREAPEAEAGGAEAAGGGSVDITTTNKSAMTQETS